MTDRPGQRDRNSPTETDRQTDRDRQVIRLTETN